MFKHWRMIRWNANVSISSKLFSSCGVIEYKFSCQLKNPQLVGYHARQPWTTPAYWVPCPITMDHPSLLGTMPDNHGPPQLIEYHVQQPWTTPAYWVPCPTTMDHPSLLGTMSDIHGPPQLIGYHAQQPWTTLVRGAQTRHVGVPLCRWVWASFLKFKRTLRNKIVAQSNIIKTKSHLAKSSRICI